MREVVVTHLWLLLAAVFPEDGLHEVVSQDDVGGCDGHHGAREPQQLVPLHIQSVQLPAHVNGSRGEMNGIIT